MPFIINYLNKKNISSLGFCGILGVITLFYIKKMPETKNMVDDF
jgi:hypothetical protein